jgi:hypothetical protein
MLPLLQRQFIRWTAYKAGWFPRLHSKFISALPAQAGIHTPLVFMLKAQQLMGPRLRGEGNVGGSKTTPGHGVEKRIASTLQLIRVQIMVLRLADPARAAE